MRIAAKIACIGLDGALAACSSLTPFARKPSPRSIPAPLAAINNKMAARTAWSLSVGSAGYTVAVGGANGALLVFNGEGKLRWKAQASSEILSAPAVGQGLVIIRSLDNRIVAYDAESGVRRWSVQRSAPSLTLRSTPGIMIACPSAFVALPGG